MGSLAQTVVDVILGEAVHGTQQQRLADMLGIASVIANRSVSMGVTPQDVVAQQSEFNAYGNPLPPGAEQYRSLAQKAWNQVRATGPIHSGMFYATPSKTGNLPSGLVELTRSTGHVFLEDPKGRAIRTAQGFRRPDQTIVATIRQNAPLTVQLASAGHTVVPGLGLANLAPNGLRSLPDTAPRPTARPGQEAARIAQAFGLDPRQIDISPLSEYGKGRSDIPTSEIVGLTAQSANRVVPGAVTSLYSGMEPAGRSPVGTAYRHPNGYAGDFDFRDKDGNPITDRIALHDIAMDMAARNNANIGYSAAERGQPGHYMGPGRMHVDVMPLGQFPGGAQWGKTAAGDWAGNLEFARQTGIGPTPYADAPIPHARPDPNSPWQADPNVPDDIPGLLAQAASPDRPDNHAYDGPAMPSPDRPDNHAYQGPSGIAPQQAEPSTGNPGDGYAALAQSLEAAGVRGLDGRGAELPPADLAAAAEIMQPAPAHIPAQSINVPVQVSQPEAPSLEAPRTINDRQVAAVSPVPTRSVQSTTISPVPESRGGLLGNLGEIAKGRGASIAGSVLGGAVAGPVGSIVGGLLGNAIRGNGSGQGLFSGGLLSGNDYATPTTGPRSTGPMAAFNPFNYRYTGHSNPLWNEPRTQAMQMWQTPSANRSMNPGFMGTGLGPMSAVYSGTAPTGFTARSASNPNVSAMSLHGMVAHTNTQHGWTAMVDPHTGVQMGTVYGKAAVYSPVDDTWSFQPMDEARMAAKRGLPTSLGPVGKQAKGLRSTDPNPAVTGKAQSKGPAAQMGLMSRGLMGPAQSIGPGKGSTGFGGLGTGGLLGMVAQALFGGPTSSPGLAGMAAGPSAGTGMGIGGGTGMGMGSFGGGFGFGGGIGDPSDSRSTNRA